MRRAFSFGAIALASVHAIQLFACRCDSVILVRAMNVMFSNRYHIDIGPHVFPTQKYGLVHARLVHTGVIQPCDVIEPEPSPWNELALVHTAEYLAKMRDGTLSEEELALLELPWSSEIDRRQLLLPVGDNYSCRS